MRKREEGADVQADCKDFVPEGCRDLPGIVVLRSVGEKRAFSNLDKLSRFCCCVFFFILYSFFSLGTIFS